MPDKIAIRALPTRRLSRRFELCRNIQRTSLCTYYYRCAFAHSEEELKVWSWMAEHQGNSHSSTLLLCIVRLYTVYRMQFLGSVDTPIIVPSLPVADRYPWADAGWIGYSVTGSFKDIPVWYCQPGHEVD